MRDLRSPCCDAEIEVIVFIDFDIEIQCERCSNLWDSTDKFESY